MNRLENKAIWPIKSYSSIPLLKILKQMKLRLIKNIFSQKLLQYIVYICETKHFTVGTFQLTLSLSSKYLMHPQQSNQLILLVSLFIASKILEKHSLTVTQLHQCSNHCFTNKDIYRCQNAILEMMNYDVLIDGIPDNYIKTILKIIEQIIPGNGYQIISEIIEDIQKYLWFCIYKGDQIISEQTPLQHLLIVIINVAFILATQCTGRFPHSIWISKIIDISQDYLTNLTQKILKIVIGKQTYKQLNI